MGVRRKLYKAAKHVGKAAVGATLLEAAADVLDARSTKVVYVQPTPQPNPQVVYVQTPAPQQRTVYVQTPPPPTQQVNIAAAPVNTGYQQHVQPVYYQPQPQRNYVTRECKNTVNQIIVACSGKIHSVGREFAYLIHRNEKSGWHNNYHCTVNTAAEIAAIARHLDLDGIEPHSSDVMYFHLANEVIKYIRSAIVVG